MKPSPVVSNFAAGDSAKGLISGWVNGARQEMHRAVAKQEIRPATGVVAVKRVRVEDRKVGAGQVRSIPVSEDQSFAKVRIVVPGSGRGSVDGGGLSRHPGGAPSSGYRGGPGAGRMVAGALADNNGAARTVGNARECSLSVAPKQTAAGLTEWPGQAILSDAALIVTAGAVKALQPTVAADVVAVGQG